MKCHDGCTCKRHNPDGEPIARGLRRARKRIPHNNDDQPVTTSKLTEADVLAVLRAFNTDIDTLLEFGKHDNT